MNRDVKEKLFSIEDFAIAAAACTNGWERASFFRVLELLLDESAATQAMILSLEKERL